MKRLPALYAVADASFGDPVDLSLRLFRGGIRLLQIRNKGASSGELLAQTARILREAPEGATVIVNDRADVASIGRASGVHLGQDDLRPRDARKILGEHTIVGLSTHDPCQAVAGSTEPVDYIAAGPVFQSSTKTGHAPVIGVEGLAEICRQVEIPVVAIGGIRLENIDEVIGAGATSVAVISDLIGHRNIESRAEQFLNRLLHLNGG